MDDNKVSHKSLSLVKSIVAALESKFGTISSVSHGPMYDFLGIKLSLTDDSKACVDMRDYLHKAVDLFNEKYLKPVATPARSNLRTIDKKSPTLNDDDRKRFHSIVMLLMCASHR